MPGSKEKAEDRPPRFPPKLEAVDARSRLRLPSEAHPARHRKRDATTQIHEAALSTIPDVPVLFWSFRIMVALGFYFIALFGIAFLSGEQAPLRYSPGSCGLAMFSLPLPWIAAELGWIVAEYGRQPWIIDGVLPTFLGVSKVPASNVLFSLLGFVLFYSVFALIDLVLIVKYVRIGPQRRA